MPCHSGMGGEDLTLGMQTSGRAMSNLCGQRAHRATLFWLIGGALVSLLASGCGTNGGMGRAMEIGPRQFSTAVLQSQQPVLVNFYKPG